MSARATGSTTLEALQRTLAAEHAAVWLYGVLGGQAAAADDPALLSRVAEGYDAHRGRRDLLAQLVRELGVEPEPSAAGYAVPGPVATSAQQSAVAARLERRLAAVYADLVTATVDGQRAWAIEALGDAAVRAVGFGAAPEAFPGLGELAQAR